MFPPVHNPEIRRKPNYCSGWDACYQENFSKTRNFYCHLQCLVHHAIDIELWNIRQFKAQFYIYLQEPPFQHEKLCSADCGYSKVKLQPAQVKAEKMCCAWISCSFHSTEWPQNLQGHIKTHSYEWEPERDTVLDGYRHRDKFPHDKFGLPSGLTWKRSVIFRQSR